MKYNVILVKEFDATTYAEFLSKLDEFMTGWQLNKSTKDFNIISVHECLKMNDNKSSCIIQWPHRRYKWCKNCRLLVHEEVNDREEVLSKICNTVDNFENNKSQVVDALSSINAILKSILDDKNNE